MTAADVHALTRLMFLANIAWLLPECLWAPTRRFIAHLLTATGANPRRDARIRERIALVERAAAPIESSDWRRGVAYRAAFRDYEEALSVLKSYRPGGWRPRLTVHGLEGLRAALDRGQGAILWVALFAGSSLGSKMALCREGFALTHLSRPSHGFSPTDFGMRFLNPIWTGIEDRYLRERITLHDGGTVAAMRQLRERLADNRVISITDVVHSKQAMEVKFLRVHRRFSTGAASLALSTGASVLPVFTIRKDIACFEVSLGDPLVVEKRGSKEESVQAVIKQYAKALEPYVRHYPDLWYGWHTVSESTPTNA